MKVTLLMSITLDGKIGKDSDHFPDWTGKEDKKLFVGMTKQAGVLIMGSKTYKTIGKPLPERRNVIMTRKTITKGAWEDQSDELVFTKNKPKEILEKLAKEGFSEVILAGGSQVNTLFAKEKLIDEVVVTICPLIFGKGIGLFGDDVSLHLSLEEVVKISDQVIKLRYKVLKHQKS